MQLCAYCSQTPCHLLLLVLICTVSSPLELLTILMLLACLLPERKCKILPDACLYVFATFTVGV